MMLALGANHRPNAKRASAIAAYLASILRTPVRLKPWRAAAGLPLYLTAQYGFYESMIHRRPALFMIADENTMATTTEIARRAAEAAKRFDGAVIIAQPGLSARQRQALIERGVAFVEPEKQFYAPDLALDLRDAANAPRQRPGDALTPAAQLVLLHRLLGASDETATPTRLAPQLGYTVMTIVRAFNEIATFELGAVQKDGREKRLAFDRPRAEIIAAAAPLLRDPAQRSFFARGVLRKTPPLAGESALAHYTDINPPLLPAYAISAGAAREDGAAFGFEEVEEDDAEMRVEIWRYDPALLAIGTVVDPLSLYPQFHHHPDERLAISADALLEAVR